MSALVLLLLAVAPHRLDSRREPGAETCPDEQAVQRAVAERLGSSPFIADAARTVTIRWRTSEAGFSSELTVVDERGARTGSRTLTSGDCSELAASTTLALALILDPMSLTRPAKPEPEAQPPPPPSSLPDPEAAPVSPPLVVIEPAPAVPAAGPPGSLWLGAGAALSYGEVPQLSAALELELAWRWRWLWAGARGTFVAPASMNVDVGQVSATLIGGGPFFCGGSSWWGGCVSLRVGALHAWPSGFSSPSSSATAVSFTAGLGPYVEVTPTRGLRLRLSVTGQVQPATAVLVVKTLEAWRAPPLSLSAGVSARWAAVGFDAEP